MTPELADATRDALALVGAALAGDKEGAAAVMCGMDEAGMALCCWAMAHWIASSCRVIDPGDPVGALASFRAEIGL